MSYAVLLRTLSKKSKLKFGKYANDEIGKLLELKKGAYLAWCYYNLSNISFTEDILDELKLDHRINKPGKDNTYWKEEGRNIRNRLMEILNENDFKVKQIQKKIFLRLTDIVTDQIERGLNKPLRNQRYNHNKLK